MRALAAVGDLGVRQPHPAEGDEQLGVGGDDRPGGLSGDGGVVAHPDDVGDDDLGC
jgi:hypothetical protein